MMSDALQPAPILQATPLEPPWSYPKGDTLPGTAPVGAADWLRVDEAYAGQMALRDRLLAERRDEVVALLPEARAPAQELLQMALQILPDLGFAVRGGEVTRPDGARVPIDTDDPLGTLGRLVQEDLCLHLKRGDAHALVGGVLCFPASWTLTEKLGRPLIGVHDPVDAYDAGVAKRVQRLFDGLRPGTVIRRGNCLAYHDFALYTPRRERERRVPPPPGEARYIRTERQCLFKLPQSQAVAFSIHTCVVARESLPQPLRRAAEAYLSKL